MDEKNIREELIKGIIGEISGPRYGYDEVIGYDPWDEYLIGDIIPSSWKINDALPDNDEIEEPDYNQTADGSTDVKTSSFSNSSLLDSRSQIKSFGISFLVNSKEPEFDVCVTWGRYFKDDKSDVAHMLNGNIEERKKGDVFWKRQSYGRIISINYHEKYNKGEYEPIYESRDGKIRLFVKFRSIGDDASHVSIYFINELNLIGSHGNFRPVTESCIFQPSIRVILKNGQSIELKSINEKNDLLDFLYRNKPIHASGHLCSVVWEDIDYFKHFSEFKDLLWPEYHLSEDNKDYLRFSQPHVRSEFLPLYSINLPEFNLRKKIENLELKPSALSNFSQKELCENFSLLIENYENWIKSNEKRARSLYDSGKISNKEFDLIFNDKDGLISKQRKILKRLKSGVTLLNSENKLVYLAFCFANKTISLQSDWKKQLTNDDEIFEWRVFQIIFILLNIESIWNEHSMDKNSLDLLWIPTGGGKTEAYLGLMAYTMALRRLKSYYGISKEKTGAGVSILSRYTLRLLTVQQFRRTLRMVTAAEYLRVYQNQNGSIGWRPKNCINDDDWIYGSVRFSVGMWVGGAVTPLHLNKNEDGAMKILKTKPDNPSSNPAQILKCPVCGAWLSVQKDQDLTDYNKNHVHIVIKSSLSDEKIESKISHIKTENYIDKPKVESSGLKHGYHVISFIFSYKLPYKYYKSVISELKSNFEIVSLNDHDIGYFGSRGPLPDSRVDDTDFEIWCTNPKCDLNHFWKEGAPDYEGEFKFPDGNYERRIKSPFEENNKIPIPAYLIDEQVYYRCPTVIVSTADKIARLAFEPRAGSLFGNVDYFNKYLGYCRKGLYPKNAPGGVKKDDFNYRIPHLLAPDLIIQDELHLMNGPLGSLFGLYELMVSGLIKQQEGNPKYIASTATINNSKHQSKMLFSKEVVQFPPHGLEIEDSFFVHESEKNIWENSKKGRIYMGIYAPGMGAFTHQIRIYCRLLKIPQDYKIFDDKLDVNSYWTIVGYYNTIRELGSAVALYKDDMLARIQHISPEDNVREIKFEGDYVELSSRKNSTELPILLDNIENDGLKNIPSYNALFTTSMFGTGVDISHLSTMVMNAQPKTTGDYIQATGRIGREKGGFILDLFRSGRPRDLNHYEMFPSYHSRIYREVEPVSVSPFSNGCLDKGLGPSITAFLRNASGLKIDWTNDKKADVILNEGALDDIECYRSFIESSLKKIRFNDKNILDKFDDCVKEWIRVAELGEGLSFMEYRNPSSLNSVPKENVVLGDPAHNDSVKVAVYKNAPQSLREIEDTLNFWV